jgi:uncharacterized protein YceK
MKRFLAGIAVVAVIGVVIAGCGSVAARTGSAHHAAAVKATPKLKRMLGKEIATLRAAQPKAPRVATTPRAMVVPQSGRTCFIAGGCSGNPCREFASAPAVYRRAEPLVRGGQGGESSRSACLPTPRKFVSGP